MAKLTGKKKAEFLARMAKGRKKAARANPSPARKKQQRKKPKGRSPHKSHMTLMKKAVKTAGRNLAKLAKTRAKAKRTRNGPRKMTAAQKTARLAALAKASKRRTHNPRRRRNADSLAEAVEKYTQFHGRAPGSVREYEQAVRYPSNFAELGKLLELRVYLDDANPDFPITGFGDCQAVTTPDGSNIYFIGGDQSLNFEALDLASDKDFVELGPCTYIMYFTVKGFHDFQPTKYWHRFGEEDEIFPRLGYDRLNKSLFLIGGTTRYGPKAS